MKKTILLKSMLLLCALIVGSSYGWADNVTLTASSGFSSSYSSDHTFSADGIGYKDSGIMYNGKGTPSGYAAKQLIQLRKSANGAGQIYNTTAINTITSVEVTLMSNNGFTLYYGTTQNPSTNSIASSSLTPVNDTFNYKDSDNKDQSATFKKFTFDLSGEGATYIKIVNGTSANYVGSIVINYAAYTITPTVNDGDMGSAVLTGSSTITATPSDGYRVIAGDDGYTVTSGTADVTNNGDNTFSVTPSTDCTVRINFEEIPKHTVTFSVNGNTDRTASVSEGGAISFPNAADTPADANEFNKTINGKTFVGWCATEYRHASTAPSYVNTSSTIMGDEDVTYYAVYATANEGTTTKTDDLTRELTGISSGGGYDEWSNKKSNSDAVFAGCTAGGNNAIQMNGTSGTSYRGIITTTSGGKVKKVTITWNSNTSNSRSVTVYGSNSAYTSMSAFNSSKGTSLGTITKGTSTELNVNDDYAYVGFYASQAIYIDNIAIDWEVNVTDYSNYNTTVTIDPDDPEDKGSTIEITTSDNMDGWRAFYDDSQDYTLDASTKAYVVRAKSENAGEVVLTKLDVTAIPQGEPVILKTSAANHKMVLTKTTGVASLGANKLAVTTGSDDVDCYRMGYGKIGGSDAVGFFKYVATTPAAGIVYIDKEYVNTGAGAHGLEITFADDETTAIKTVNAEKQLTAPRKVMKDGRIVVETNEGMFSLTGARVK